MASALVAWSVSALELLNPSLAPAVMGVPYRAGLLVSGNPQPFAYGATISGLPDGLTANYNYFGSFEISGTPTTWGEFKLQVEATNGIYTRVWPVSLRVNRYSNRVTASSGTNSSYCAVSDGALYCGGGNASPKIVPGAPDFLPEPKMVMRPNRSVIDVSLGGGFACAVAGGGVYCWGRGGSGQLGLGNGDDVATGPGSATIPAGSGATAVSAGISHACAVVNGGVQCWGTNAYGQLGDGGTTSSNIPVNALAMGGGATSVASGPTATCAVVNAGVRCWGRLGPAVNFPTPHEVIAGGSGAAAVSLNGQSACALVGGVVQCWGQAWWQGTNEYQYSNTPVALPALGSSLTDLWLGGEVYLPGVCVVGPAGASRCFGAGAIEVTANTASANIGPLSVPPLPMERWTPTVKASLAFESPCAVAGGRMRCPLSRDVETNTLWPAQILPGGSNVTQVSAGSTHTCALINGGVSCWGNNSLYRLGNSTVRNSIDPMVALPQGSGVTQISAGDDATCVIRNGGVQCWGYAGRGQLGNGESSGVFASPVWTIPSGSGATHVSVGYDHACAVVAGGIRCWGWNANGELGVTTSTSLNTTPVQTLVAGSGATRVSAGFNHTCAVASGGLRCWGRNLEGQLGTGNKTGGATVREVIAPNSGVTEVSAGTYHTCVARDGVWCWGANTEGQLGIDGVSEALLPSRIVAGGPEFQVAAAHSHTCWMHAAYGVRCWGSSAYGQRGDGGVGNGASATDAMNGQIHASSLSASASTTCVSANLGVLCWGRNYWRAIGDRQTDPNRFRHVAVSDFATPLNVDATPAPTLYSASSDGLMAFRYLLGLSGDALVTGAIGEAALRTDAGDIETYLASIRPMLDIDGNGEADSATDGLLILRYLFGFRGDALIADAIATTPTPSRNTASLIEAYLSELVP